MPDASHRYIARSIVLVALAAFAVAHAAQPLPVEAFGSAVAAEWNGAAFTCPDGGHEWFGSTPETLYCFRVELSGLSIRARLDTHLARNGTWLNTWRTETRDLISRPYWSDNAVYRILVASSAAAPRSSVVFILLASSH